LNSKKCKTCDNLILECEVKSLAHAKYCSYCKYEKTLAANRRYREKNAEKCSDLKKAWYRKNRLRVAEKNSEYARANRDRVVERKRQWYEQNKDSVKGRVAENHRKKMASDDFYRSRHTLRGVVSGAFTRKGYTKRSKAYDLLGCSYEEFMAMNGLDPNVGIPDGHHIDHIVPCSMARNIEELEKLQHYSNLRIVKAEVNLAKHGALLDEDVDLYRELIGGER
jgi:hypothetical protein